MHPSRPALSGFGIRRGGGGGRRAMLAGAVTEAGTQPRRCHGTWEPIRFEGGGHRKGNMSRDALNLRMDLIAGKVLAL